MSNLRLRLDMVTWGTPGYYEHRHRTENWRNDRLSVAQYIVRIWRSHFKAYEIISTGIMSGESYFYKENILQQPKVCLFNFCTGSSSTSSLQRQPNKTQILVSK